ncbi:MAG: PilZ domain-containing protein [Pyrinomonadaceae bacterium]|nr:PilZ domain-containing protein [Pyrinomonadaceae bacterium]
MNTKDPRGETSPSQRPRSPRVPVEFALEVEGSTPAGKSFHVKAQAIKISRAGATIILDEEVVVGSVVTLTPPFGRKLEAQVNGAWTDEMDKSRRIGVKLLDTDGWFAE